METIGKVVAELAQVRAEKERLQAGVLAATEQLMASTLGCTLTIRQEALKHVKEQEVGLMAQVRRLAEATGEKNPHPAIKVKSFTVLRYLPETAMAYCHEHLPQALELNTAVFERVAKTADLDFVIKAFENRATIARDLAAWLPPEHGHVVSE